ncbi:MAG: hypothetical protein LBS75_09635 [Synergistaceae bacterium]|jgi:hypothetical protein|nr:hypothetical protein [Synergistaceae bacterium]
MNCPHGKKIVPVFQYGVRLFTHENGDICDLCGSLDANCEGIALANMRGALASVSWGEHMSRVAYSSYKVSADARFFWMEGLCSLDAAGFTQKFTPVRMALMSEDEAALSGLYLMELYYAFRGISGRINAANEAVAESPLYIFLGSLGAPRVIPHENEVTRAYALTMNERFARFKNVFRIPV